MRVVARPRIGAASGFARVTTLTQIKLVHNYETYHDSSDIPTSKETILGLVFMSLVIVKG